MNEQYLLSYRVFNVLYGSVQIVGFKFLQIKRVIHYLKKHLMFYGSINITHVDAMSEQYLSSYRVFNVL